MTKIGSKKQVYEGSAYRTTGGLHKSDLMKNKKGKIISKRKHQAGKIAFKKYLQPLSK